MKWGLSHGEACPRKEQQLSAGMRATLLSIVRAKRLSYTADRRAYPDAREAQKRSKQMAVMAVCVCMRAQDRGLRGGGRGTTW